MKKGNISVSTENIFPIIKKFLYEDHDIFVRELVSNAVDATHKLKTLAAAGKTGEIAESKVVLSIDKEAKTITFSDSGLGMTEEEVEKYINTLALSGATEFMEQYKDKTESEIIGHFGLGFYSSFMVADTVTIDTLSYKKDAKPVFWESNGSTEYTIKKGKRKEVGTTITLHISDDSEEFLEDARLGSVLKKYCSFLPVDVEFNKELINETKPLWTKNPSDLKDEDYLDFYKKLYPMQEAPLFWIHLNVDYPFNLEGILYFPKITGAIDREKFKVQLYCNQVFVTDDVRDILPEYLLLLQGVIDSPDIPLNVSRSALQGDPNVKKVAIHISKKVADKLKESFKNDRANFEEKWEYLEIFAKYGALSDEKFAERVKDIVLLKNSAGKYFTNEEYQKHTATNQKGTDDKTIWLYANDKEYQHSFIKEAEDKSYDVLLFENQLDNHFVSYLENKVENIQLKRVDSEPISQIIKKEDETDSVLTEKEIEKLKTSLSDQFGAESYDYELLSLSPKDKPFRLLRSEFDRRMREMSQMQGQEWMKAMPEKYKVVVNTNHKAVKKILTAKGENKAKNADYLMDLAMLEQGLLKGEKLTTFLNKSVDLLS